MFLNLALCVFATVGRNLRRRQQLRLMLVATIVGMAVREVIVFWITRNVQEEKKFCEEATKVKNAIFWSKKRATGRLSIFSCDRRQHRR